MNFIHSVDFIMITLMVAIGNAIGYERGDYKTKMILWVVVMAVITLLGLFLVPALSFRRLGIYFLALWFYITIEHLASRGRPRDTFEV